MATPSPREPPEVQEPGARTSVFSASSRGRVALRMILLAAGLLLAAWLLRTVGWPAIAANLERIGARRLLLLAGLYTFSQAAFALGWRLVVDSRLAAVPFRTLFAFYLAGDSLNYVAPGGVAGEPIKARLLGQRTGMEQALASLTIHKHADLVAQWAFVTLGVVYAVLRFPMPAAARAAALAGAAGLGGLLFVLSWAMRRGTYGPILRRLARWKVLSARLDRYRRSAESVDRQIGAFSAARRGRYLASVAACFAGWCGGVLETFLILRFLFSSADWGTALAVESLALALNNMFLFIPGRVGSAEGVRAAVFVLLGMPAAQGVAYGLVRRGREMVWTLPGFAVLIGSHASPPARESRGPLPAPAREEPR